MFTLSYDSHDINFDFSDYAYKLAIRDGNKMEEDIRRMSKNNGYELPEKGKFLYCFSVTFWSVPGTFEVARREEAICSLGLN